MFYVYFRYESYVFFLKAQNNYAINCKTNCYEYSPEPIFTAI